MGVESHVTTSVAANAKSLAFFVLCWHGILGGIGRVDVVVHLPQVAWKRLALRRIVVEGHHANSPLTITHHANHVADGFGDGCMDGAPDDIVYRATVGERLQFQPDITSFLNNGNGCYGAIWIN